jgi:hypothetical protein
MLWLCLRADGLAWKKFNGTEKGRALELIAYCNGWYDLPKRGADQAANLAVQRLGLGNVSAEQLARDRAAAKERAPRRRRQRQAPREKAAAAFAIFAKAAKPISARRPRSICATRAASICAPPFIGPRGGNIAPGSLRYAAQHRY